MASAMHGWSHTAFTELDPEVLTVDISRTEAILRELSGAECRDIRPPYGVYDQELISRLEDRGLVTWLWTARRATGPPARPPTGSHARSSSSLTPGGIVLLHDGGGERTETVRALPRIIEGAHARGFRFQTLDEVRTTGTGHAGTGGTGTGGAATAGRAAILDDLEVIGIRRLDHGQHQRHRRHGHAVFGPVLRAGLDLGPRNSRIGPEHDSGVSTLPVRSRLERVAHAASTGACVGAHPRPLTSMTSVASVCGPRRHGPRLRSGSGEGA